MEGEIIFYIETYFVTFVIDLISFFFHSAEFIMFIEW